MAYVANIFCDMTQQTRDIDPILGQRWTSVVEDGALLDQGLVIAGIQMFVDPYGLNTGTIILFNIHRNLKKHVLSILYTLFKQELNCVWGHNNFDLKRTLSWQFFC